MENENKSKVYVLAAAAVIIIAGLFWYFYGRTEVVVVAENMAVSGDYVVEKGTRVEISNGAVITVEGDTDIFGEISGDEKGVAIVAKGNVTFDKDAKITAKGNVQIVGDASALAGTQEKIDEAFDEAGRDEGVEPRFGPFVPASGGTSSSGIAPYAFDNTETRSAVKSGVAAFLTKTARAADAQAADEPDVIVTLSGTIDLSGADAADEKSRKRIIIVSFPPSAGKVQMILKDLNIIGPQNTPRGVDDNKKDKCITKGGKGSDGLRLRGHAWGIEINNFTVALAKGGDGGDAETKIDCDPGVARGGEGGDSGNMKLTADNNFKITGAFHIIPGKGGNGGAAIAHGKDAGPGQTGGKAEAYGGKGNNNKKELSAKGTVTGLTNITVDVLVGGDGGNATANGGNGGDNVGCGKNGGAGGEAIAEGGKGGDASLIVFGAPSPVFDIGGNGGNADALGGKGGNGGNCDAKGKGGNGGKGGNATDKEGKGGAGDTAGIDGTGTSFGGNGGNGGSGCPEGKGGKGGTGDTPGADGSDGKNLCAAVEQPKTTGAVGGGTPPAVATAKMSFAHVAPGEYSEVYMDITGVPGARANAALSGPAVEQPNASGVIGADGKLRLKWRIYQYGIYKASGAVGDSPVSGTAVVN